MTIDHDSIAEKKAVLQKSIRILRQSQKYSIKKIHNDEMILGAILHYLMIGIESILDIGSHILTENFQVSPSSYEDVIVMLGEQKVIAKKLASSAKGMGQFRNKMIHEYADIDVKKVHAYLQKAPDQFTQFDKAFGSHLRNVQRKR